jgi:hypothetical protein
LKKMCSELAIAARVSFRTIQEQTDGTLFAAMAAWSANSDSLADLDFRRAALKIAGSSPTNMVRRREQRACRAGDPRKTFPPSELSHRFIRRTQPSRRCRLCHALLSLP